MKSLSLIGLASAGMVAFSSTAFATSSSPLYDVLSVGGTYGSGVIDWWAAGSSRESIDLIANLGGLNLAAGYTESSPFIGDGGTAIYGGPVRVIVGGWDGTDLHNDGAFEVWGLGDAVLGTTAFPALKIDTGLNTAAFKGVNVTIDPDGTTGGALTVGGKAVLTQGNAATAFGLGTATGSNSFAAGNGLTTASGAFSFAATGGSAASLNSAAIGSGSVADANSAVAVGNLAKAHATSSIALGYGSTTISGANNSAALSSGTTYGQYSTAVSLGTATGSGSFASGSTSSALGYFSFAGGAGVKAQSYAAAAFGIYNNNYASQNAISFVDTDSLFSLGNGTSDTLRSDAILTLKNGQTNLTNKYWDSAHPVAAVSGTTQSAGEALVVNGNTRLRGKVVLEQAQGDISMGIYSTP